MTTSRDRQQRVIEITEALDTIHARERKPVEVMISAINLPIDELGSRMAGHVLDDWENGSGLNIEGCEAIAKRWSPRTGIAQKLGELKELDKVVRFNWKIPTAISVIVFVICIITLVAVSLVFQGQQNAQGSQNGQQQQNLQDQQNGQQQQENIPEQQESSPLLFILQTVVGASIAIIITVWGVFWVSWRDALRRKNRAVSDKRKELIQEITNGLNEELAGMLEGHKKDVSYGKWFIDYPFAASHKGDDDDAGKRNVERFKEFLTQETPLFHIVEKFDPRHQSRIRQFLTRSIRQRVRSGDWIQGDRRNSGTGPSIESFASAPNGDGRSRSRNGNVENKNVVLIPIGHEENMSRYKVNEGDFKGIPGVNLTFQATSRVDFLLSCMYVILRSPTEESELGKWQSYEEIYRSSSELEIDKHDPAPEDSTLLETL